MFLWKKYFRKFLMISIGCILDENGEELTADEAKEFMESYFYSDIEQEEEAVKLKYKLALLEFWK